MLSFFEFLSQIASKNTFLDTLKYLVEYSIILTIVTNNNFLGVSKVRWEDP